MSSNDIARDLEFQKRLFISTKIATVVVYEIRTSKYRR